MNLAEHSPIDTCFAVHCHVHDVDEPAGPATYIWCFECGHVYRTARELRRAYRLAVRRIEGRWSWWRLRAWLRRASTIRFCQHCLHDF